jgi:hypothetical protein
MSKDIGHQLNWFLYNLDLQLDDFKLEAANRTVELYFDAHDAISAILGLHDFYDPDTNAFNRREFEKPERLVYCLATSNWLGPIQLLPPHQAEFLTFLKLEFGVALERDPVGAARKFLEHVGFTDMGHRITSVRDISQEEMFSLVQQQAGHAKEFFKAIQSMVPWHKRLPSMLSKGTLQLNPQKIDYEMIIAHPRFPDLVSAFNEERPNKGPQNLADAFAIIVLSRKVGLYRTGEAKIPRVFASSSSFRKVVQREEFASLLNYDQTPEGIPISAFRNEDYFIFKCTFRRDIKQQPNNGGVTSEEVHDELQKLRDELSRFLKARSEISVTETLRHESAEVYDAALMAEIEKITAFGKPLTKAMEELQKFSFLENVWLQSAAPQDLAKAVRQLVDSAKEVRFKKSKRFKSATDRALGNVKNKLTENVRDVEWVMSLWEGLNRQIDDIFSRVNKSQYRSLDYFRDLGLLRYSFPSATYEKIETILRQLFEKGDTEKYARRFVIVACLTAVKDAGRDPGNLIAAVAILRAARMDSEIVELFCRIDGKLPHFSLKIVYAESIFSLLKSSRLRPSWFRELSERLRDLIDELERDHTKATKGQTQADIAVGLAYLHFRRWRYQGGEALWRKGDESEDVSDSQLQEVIDRAISYAKQGYHYFKGQHDELKEVYALNIYLYYLVEGGQHNRENEIEKVAAELTRYSDKPEVWQYRFDDTLARYYYRRAETKDKLEDWERLIQMAKSRINSAAFEGIRDSDVEGCMAMIDKAIDRGFVGKHWFFDHESSASKNVPAQV